MAERVTVTCPKGHSFTTTVRGRGTRCPQDGRTVYVRQDGTTLQRPAAPPADDWADYELWELHHVGEAPESVEAIAESVGIPASTVRRRIAAEERRRESAGLSREEWDATTSPTAPQLA
jgi:hypothetical protein